MKHKIFVLLLSVMGLWPTTTGTDLKKEPKQLKVSCVPEQGFFLFNPFFLFNK